MHQLLGAKGIMRCSIFGIAQKCRQLQQGASVQNSSACCFVALVTERCGNRINRGDLLAWCMQIAMVTDSKTLHHYWSHSDVNPWSADGRLLLSQRADVGGVREVVEGSRSRLVQEIGYTNFTAGDFCCGCGVNRWT